MKNEYVSLVIPGRDCAATIGECLEALSPLLTQDGTRLREIIFVDDGSTDDTRKIVAEYPVRVVESGGRGPGAARNAGWRAAENELVWFVDSDCVADGDPLTPLLSHLDESNVAAVSGSYGNMRPDSLLACLIHEEIVERHLAMPAEVNFLATFNVIYRRHILAELDGFDERYLKAQDAELSFRVLEAGYRCRFEFSSKVKHHHPTRWLSYLRTQRHQGYWRVFLHMRHKGHATKSHYSSSLDHVQPPLAMITLASLFLVFLPYGWIAPAVCIVGMGVAQIPMTWRIVRRTNATKYVLFGWMSAVRSFWRGVGMSRGVIDYLSTSDGQR